MTCGTCQQEKREAIEGGSVVRRCACRADAIYLGPLPALWLARRTGDPSGDAAIARDLALMWSMAQ